MSDNNANAVISRRAILQGIAGTLAAASTATQASKASAESLNELVIHGPPAGPSVTVAHAIATGRFLPVADKASIKVWRNPDELRAGLTSGAMSVAVMPVQVAANMYNRGMGIRLVNTLTDGLLYIISESAEITDLDALRGRSLAVPFRNDTPDLVLRRMLDIKGIDAKTDIEIQSMGTPIEALQNLLSGRVDAALVPEPAAAAAIVKGATAGKTIRRVIDIQESWSEATGLPPLLPQAGLAVTDAFLKVNRARIDAIHAALVSASISVNADPARAASDAAAALEMPWPVLEKAAPFSRLAATRAIEARPVIETILNTLADADPAIIGGKLPDDGFYL